MAFSNLLEKGRIQTKIAVMIMPLLTGIVALSIVNFTAGSMPAGRLHGTNAGIVRLGGYKLTYERIVTLRQRAIFIMPLLRQG